MAVAITCGYGGYLLPLLAAHSSSDFDFSSFQQPCIAAVIWRLNWPCDISGKWIHFLCNMHFLNHLLSQFKFVKILQMLFSEFLLKDLYNLCNRVMTLWDILKWAFHSIPSIHPSIHLSICPLLDEVCFQLTSNVRFQPDSDQND